jgi:prevent-host-death family protein
MKTIGAFEAKTHLSELLDQVARGQSFLITKRGKAVASLSPIAAGGNQSFRELIEDFRRRHRVAARKITSREISEFKEIGRR